MTEHSTRAEIKGVAGIVLAAGSSQRMGETKALLRFGGLSFVETVCQTMRRAGLTSVIVVAGADSERTQVALPSGLAVVVVNPRPQDGMLSSLRVGLRCLDEAVEVAAVALVDQPAVSSQVYQHMLRAWQKSRVDVVIPCHGRRRGHPILLGRTAWPLCFAGPVEEGLRWVTHHPDVRVKEVDVRNPAVTLDVDTPEDYRRLSEG